MGKPRKIHGCDGVTLLVDRVYECSRNAAVEISKRAINHSFSWSSVVPSNIRDWLELFALTHNTRSEFIFMGATAAIMGPEAKGSRYEEPTNINYVICLAEPESLKRSNW